MNTNITLKYYDQNAQDYYLKTNTANTSSIINTFSSYLKPGSLILDFGCGSGRDSKLFIEKGFKVEAIDGSKEMCKLAEKNIGISVKQMSFNELDDNMKYDGIWACASILHLCRADLIIVLRKISKALKEEGVVYISFKYGEKEGFIDNRYYIYLTENSLKNIIANIPSLSIMTLWKSSDVLSNRSTKWLNAILKKDTL